MNKNILIVDDEPGVLDVLSQTFEMENYKPLCANSGVEAIEILDNKDINVFFVDIQMPQMNGLELCTRIRKQNPTAFICAMTGFSSIYGLIQCYKTGFDDYFTKPFNIMDVLQIVSFAFNRTERWMELSNCNKWQQKIDNPSG